MLKINKILSKKIKFPLSLRGAKQRSNLSGFSLIELMVAVAILAVASIGIFQAFTVGFQAMADSKDRTVATNIAQKKLEEVKNSVSVAYPYYSIESQELNGKTFTIKVATNPKEENLEQVIVTVSWKNRNGIEKNVQLETLIYDLEIKYDVPGPDVGRIALSANPTALTCCVATETSTITAEIFDKSVPEQRVLSGTPVSFSVNNGNVDPEFTVTDSIGKAYTALTINGLGPAKKVRASSGGVYSDFLKVTCTPEADKIDLSANPSAIIPGSTSTITATVTDTCGSVISNVTVEFNTNKGTLLSSTDNTDSKGKATVTLSSMANGDTATVTGTVTLYGEETITDSTTVICTNYSISVSAEPTSITPAGSSTITATLTQSEASNPTGETISFTTDKGTLSASTANTNSEGKATVFLSSLVGGDIATITASYEITTGNTISDTATVQCTEYLISIVANPDKVIPGSTSTITATLTNYEGNPASNRRVDFYTTKGILSDTSVYTNSSGIAVTTLTLNTVGDIANVNATFGFASDSVNVECIEFILVLNAVPTSITPGGSSEITAILTNYLGTSQSGQTITFTTSTGILSTTNPVTSGTTVTAVTNSSGEALVHLVLNTAGTTAVVTAEYDVVEDTVTIECSESTYITLHDPPSLSDYNYSDARVYFSIDLHGGPLVIDKVKVEWQTDYNGYPSRYRFIEIRRLGSYTWTQIYNMDHSNNGTIETLNRNSPYTLEADGTYQIRVYFSYTLRNRHVIFTLNPDDPGADENYQVEFTTPNY